MHAPAGLGCVTCLQENVNRSKKASNLSQEQKAPCFMFILLETSELPHVMSLPVGAAAPTGWLEKCIYSTEVGLRGQACIPAE